MFQNEGIHYTLSGKTGNTFNSHRLIALAGREGPEMQERMVSNLFRAYFEEVRCSHNQQLPHQTTSMLCLVNVVANLLVASQGVWQSWVGPCGGFADRIDAWPAPCSVCGLACFALLVCRGGGADWLRMLCSRQDCHHHRQDKNYTSSSQPG